MRIIARRTLVEFMELHPDSKAQLEAWYYEVRKADWEKPSDVLEQYSRASTIGDRVVFRKGNDYRIVVRINYKIQVVYICFVGTHAEYDRIDPSTVWNY